MSRMNSRAKTHEEIVPLKDLCKAGKLFEVQDWIARGKPVDPPPPEGRRQRKKSPLEHAIEAGFHSLVKVLLTGGARIEPDGPYDPMTHALAKRRLDIVQLLVEHGFDPKSVDMTDVFSTWDPVIMEYFIDRGAEVDRGNPLAWALCNRIRTALRIFQKYHKQFDSFRQQVDIALRYHCKNGNLKWVSLMLWTGADPFSRGPVDPDEELGSCDPDDAGTSALAWAAIYRHFDVFTLKKIRLDPSDPGWHDVMGSLTRDQGVDILKQLLEKGLNPNDQQNGGCSAIQQLLNQLDWHGRTGHYSYCSRDTGYDNSTSREGLKVIHLLAKHGARWEPEDRYQISAARRSLLKMIPDYTVEFIWIMAKHGACSRENAETLVRTPTMRAHTKKFAHRISELIGELQSAPATTVT